MAVTASAGLEIPPFPPIVHFVDEVLADPMARDQDLRHVIEQDEGLSQCLVRYANSAWMARRQRVKTLDDALAVVGLAGIRSLMLTEWLASLFTSWGRVQQFLWEHALASAITAALERPGAGRATEDVYLCGLLHNVGKVLLDAQQPEGYEEVVVAVREGGDEFCDVEERCLGCTHAGVGAALLRDLDVPGLVRQTAEYHHDVASAPPDVAAACGLLVVADAIAYRVSPAWEAIRPDTDQPEWVGARLQERYAGASRATVRAREELIRVELRRMRSYLRAGKGRESS